MWQRSDVGREQRACPLPELEHKDPVAVNITSFKGRQKSFAPRAIRCLSGAKCTENYPLTGTALFHLFFRSQPCHVIAKNKRMEKKTREVEERRKGGFGENVRQEFARTSQAKIMKQTYSSARRNSLIPTGPII